MDASASTEVNNSRFNEVCDLYFNVDNVILPTSLNRDKKVVKYTKLPEFDFDSKASWSRHSYTLPPRLRRIIALDDQDILLTSRSLQHEQKPPQRFMSGISKRKIVTINEDDENEIRSIYPKQIMSVRKETQANRAVTAALSPVTTSSRVTSPRHSRSSRSIKTASLASTKNLSNKVSQKASNASKIYGVQNYNSKVHTVKEKDNAHSNHNLTYMPKFTEKRNKFALKERNKFDLKEKVPRNIMRNKVSEQPYVGKTALSTSVQTPKPFKPPVSSKLEATLFKEIKAQNRHNDVVKEIHVPVVEKYESQNLVETMMTHIIVQPIEKECMMNLKIDKYTEVDEKANIDMNVGTDSSYELVDKSTEMEKSDLKPTFVDASLVKSVNNFDSLDIPNVTLIKDRSDIPKEDEVRNDSQSLPSLEIPATNLQLSKGTIPANSEEDNEKDMTNSTSYIISRATLTYTTKQKINFHVFGNKSHSATDLYSSPLSYPMNVVSVYKKEIKKRDLKDVVKSDKNTHNKKDQLKIENVNPWKEIKSLDCSKFFDTSKLVKPSDVITTIGVNGDFLQNDFICEQFQRELNFIDSFFESLQYLESCSLSNKCFDDDRVEKWVSKSGFDFINYKHDSLFSKFDNDANNEDTETIASKSLCLLNLLIRDERRRAKNLLFVLKMREDALKDFTKSQILWLENKKKQENTDISTLKKKQRGALLKLQHECGEMQRMRKALLALSEKRKVALMKTKKNIELKLNNNVNVDQIVLGKKKIKRNTADRNVAPLKCFDLSSSGCDDSILHHLTRPKSDSALLAESIVTCAEKSIQTSESVPLKSIEPVPAPALLDQATSTAAEHYVVVDGGYLNILFQNLSLPLIFSAGKQYEVNEEALKNIVNSTNSYNSNLNDSDLVGKFMYQIKSRDLDKSSSPSTARSLVEEFDQYYNGLVEAENSPSDSEGTEFKTITDPVPNHTYVLGNENMSSQEQFKTPFFSSISSSTVTLPHDGNIVSNKLNEGANVDLYTSFDDYTADVDKQSEEVQARGGADSVALEAGPLPVLAGSPAATATATTATMLVDVLAGPVKKSSTSLLSAVAEGSVSSPSSCPSVSSVTYSPPTMSEAEELRRQQLAIEREIKALEQQQILVVREIPDKPPPPYTPPTESRSQKSLRMFTVDETVEQKIASYITNPVRGPDDPQDPLDVYVNDYCLEKIEKHKLEDSDKPWVACNLLPQKPQLDIDKLVQKATAEMKEILAGVHPTAVTGVSARRSDHIDDILFAEWRRFEPEWSALHIDEASVKNQIFESIFQKLLSESVDEYKKNVLNVNLSASDGQNGG